MRLRDIVRTIYDNVEKLEFDAREIPPGNWGLRNFRGVFEAAAAINETGALKAETEVLLGMSEIARHLDEEVFVSRDRYLHFSNLVHQIKIRSELLGMTISNMLPSEKPEQIIVRLPDDPDLEATAETILEVHKALNLLVVNPDVGGEVRLIEFDRGSNWVELSLGSLAALQVLALALRLIYDVRLKEVEVMTRLELFRNLKLKNDAAEAIKEALEEEVRVLRESRLVELAGAAKVSDADHEGKLRLEHSISLLAELVNKGVEVHPSLLTPVEIRDVYPNPLKLIAAAKQLSGAKPQLETS